MLQNETLMWLVGYVIPVLSLTAVPAYLLWLAGGYAEAVVYNSHRPSPVVPQNSRHEWILRAYKHDRQKLDLMLLSLYACSTILILMAGILLGSTQGLALGLVVSASMVSHLRHGIHLEDRVEKNLAREKRVLSGDAKLFG